MKAVWLIALTALLAVLLEPAHAETVTPTYTPWVYQAEVCVAPDVYGAAESQAVSGQLAQYFTNQCGTGSVQSSSGWATSQSGVQTCGGVRTPTYQGGLEIKNFKALDINASGVACRNGLQSPDWHRWNVPDEKSGAGVPARVLLAVLDADL